jgi:hypothetical protein
MPPGFLISLCFYASISSGRNYPDERRFDCA